MIGEDILSDFGSHLPKLVGCRTAEGHIRILRKMLKPFNVKLNKILDTSNSSFSCMTVGGFYDPGLDFGNKDIQIYLSINEFQSNDKFDLDVPDATILIVEIFKTLMHELRHRYQYSIRAYDTFRPVEFEDREQDYYSDPDELDAYAREAAIEMSLGNRSATKDKYKELFHKDSQVLKRFLKKYYLAYTHE